MKLAQEIQRILNALAYANAGDYLTLWQKDRVLAGSTVAATPPEPVTHPATGPQVGLYLGSELPAEVMQYVIQTCSRLRYGLCVLTFQPHNDAEALLAPYRKAIEAAGIRVELVLLAGEPPAALIDALRKHPDVAFLICNESGYLGHSLLKGSVRRDAIPVPVVLVASRPTPAVEANVDRRAA